MFFFLCLQLAVKNFEKLPVINEAAEQGFMFLGDVSGHFRIFDTELRNQEKWFF